MPWNELGMHYEKNGGSSFYCPQGILETHINILVCGWFIYFMFSWIPKQIPNVVSLQERLKVGWLLKWECNGLSFNNFFTGNKWSKKVLKWYLTVCLSRKYIIFHSKWQIIKPPPAFIRLSLMVMKLCGIYIDIICNYRNFIIILYEYICCYLRQIDEYLQWLHVEALPSHFHINPVFSFVIKEKTSIFKIIFFEKLCWKLCTLKNAFSLSTSYKLVFPKKREKIAKIKPSVWLASWAPCSISCQAVSSGTSIPSQLLSKW